MLLSYRHEGRLDLHARKIEIILLKSKVQFLGQVSMLETVELHREGAGTEDEELVSV